MFVRLTGAALSGADAGGEVPVQISTTASVLPLSSTMTSRRRFWSNSTIRSSLKAQVPATARYSSSRPPSAAAWRMMTQPSHFDDQRSALAGLVCLRSMLPIFESVFVDGVEVPGNLRCLSAWLQVDFMGERRPSKDRRGDDQSGLDHRAAGAVRSPDLTDVDSARTGLALTKSSRHPGTVRYRAERRWPPAGDPAGGRGRCVRRSAHRDAGRSRL